jgi:hypothetical protein
MAVVRNFYRMSLGLPGFEARYLDGILRHREEKLGTKKRFKIKTLLERPGNSSL